MRKVEKMNNKQPQQVSVGWASVAGFSFALGGMIAVDMTEYNESDGQPPIVASTRWITLHLMYGVTHVFKAEMADEFYTWWTELSTPKQVEGVAGIIRPVRH